MDLEEVYYDGENTLPLGIMGCALKKIESFENDMEEILEDEEIDDIARTSFTELRNGARYMMRTLVAIAGREIPEEEFLAEVDMMSDLSDT